MGIYYENVIKDQVVSIAHSTFVERFSWNGIERATGLHEAQDS